jgi:hypothetical protein
MEGLHTKLWAPKVVGVPTLEISGLGNREINDIWVVVTWPGIEYIIRGKVVASPSPGRGESREFVFARGSSVHQRNLGSTLTNLLFGLCRSM